MVNPAGEGDSTPLQFSCLENPMDGGAWYAAVHGVATSRTRLSNLAAEAAGHSSYGHFHSLVGLYLKPSFKLI